MLKKIIYVLLIILVVIQFIHPKKILIPLLLQ